MKVLIATALCALSLNSAAAWAEEAAPYPVWWSPELGLESLDQIDERLERKFWPNEEEGLLVYKGEWPGDNQAFIESCASYQELTKQGYYARYNYDIQILLFHSATCHAIELLRQAQPSQESYVSEITLDTHALEILPAMINPSPSCDFLCRQYVANKRRIPWNKFEVENFLSVHSIDERRLDVITDVTDLTIEILARADFSSDGLEDLLVRANAHATGGTWGTTELLLLTRETPDSVLWVLDADKELCRDYTCEPCYDYPEALRVTD